jgi:hypothetical protein
MRAGHTATDKVAEKQHLKAEISIWKRIPIKQLLQEDANRYQFNGVTYYPGVEPWFFLALELALLVFFISTCRRLLDLER